MCNHLKQPVVAEIAALSNGRQRLRMEPPAEPADAPVPWDPSLPVHERSSLGDIINTLSFGRNDASDFHAIRDKLATRKCATLGSIKDYGDGELTSMIRALKLPKNPRIYIG